MNSVELIGNIASDITLRLTKTNKQVAHFQLAINYRKETYFVPIVCWDAMAVNVSQYCRKGSRIGVTGHLKSESWEDHQDKKHTRLIVLAHTIEFLTPKSEAAENESIDLLDEA